MKEHLAPHSKDENKREQGTDADDNEYRLQAAFILILHNDRFRVVHNLLSEVVGCDILTLLAQTVLWSNGCWSHKPHYYI